MRTLIGSVSLPATLAILAAGCASPFDADRGAYSASVTGDLNASLSGSAYYPSLVSDDPPQVAMLLTDTDEPILRFVFDVSAIEARSYTVDDVVPGGAVRITFEPNDIAEPHYVADTGQVTFTEVSASEATGTFSFEAARGIERITVNGSFQAEL